MWHSRMQVLSLDNNLLSQNNVAHKPAVAEILLSPLSVDSFFALTVFVAWWSS